MSARHLFLWILLLIGFALAPAQSTPSSRPITLRYTVWDGEPAINAIKAAVKSFEDAHPGIKVKLETIGDYNLYHQKMLVQFAGGVAPDVAMMDPQNFQRLARRRALLPLNGFLTGPDPVDITDYYAPIVKAQSWDGNLYVLPRDIAPFGILYYNKRIFDEAGIPYPSDEMTWDYKIRPELQHNDFLWLLERLTKKDKNGRVTRWAFSAAWAGFFTDYLAFNQGLSYADNDEDPTRVTFGDGNWLKVFEFYRELTDEKKWVASQADVQQFVQSTVPMMFARGQLAMFQSGIWEVPNLRKFIVPGTKEFFEWDIALMPRYVNGTRRHTSGGSGYAIFSSTKHPREAWLLTRWMAGAPGQSELARAGVAMPAMRSLALSELWLGGPNAPESQKYPPSRITTHRAVEYAAYTPTGDVWPEVNSLIGAKVNSIFTGSMTPERGVREGRLDGQNRLNVLRREERLPAFPWPPAILLGLLAAGGTAWWVYRGDERRKLTVRERSDNRSAYWFIAPWLFGFVVFTFGPMLLSFFMSFANWDIITPAQWRGLGNYREAFFEDPRFWTSLRVTSIYTIFGVPLGIAFGLGLALLLNQKVWGMPLFRAMYYLPSLASLVAASLIWRRIFNPDDGLLNTVIYGYGVTDPSGGLGQALSTWAGTPDKVVNWIGNEITALPALILMSLWGVGGAMIILLAGLQGIPQMYYEAATVDGAGPWHKFKAVTLPLLSPALFFTLVTGFIGSFQVFAQAFIITGGGPNDSTLFYMLYLYNNAFTGLRMGYSAALAWVLFFIVLVLTVVQLRMSKWVHYEAEAK